MESQHSVGCQPVMTFEDLYSFRRNCGLKSEVVDNVQAKFDFSEKRPLTDKFSQNFSERIHADMDPRLVCKFREIWLTENRWNRAMFTRQKKFRSLSRSRFWADRAQNLSDNILGVCQISSKSVHFRRSYGRTRERRSNAPKVLPILGEASTSSPSIN